MDYPGELDVIQGCLQVKEEKRESQENREARLAIADFKSAREAYRPRNVGCLQKLTKAGSGASVA